MHAPREVQVAVTNADGLALEGATAFVLVDGGQSPQARTDSSGRALLQIPDGATCRAIAAFKEGAGFDYRLVWKPHEIRIDPYRLPPELPQTVSLILDGARSVQVRVRDRQGFPIAGARVGTCSMSKPYRGSYLYSAFQFANRITGTDGIATFDFIQRDLAGPNHFTAEKDGWEKTDLAVLDADRPEPLLDITLVPLVPITGRVCDASRVPVAGASVHASAAAYHFNQSQYHTTTDADGTFKLHVAAGRLCVIFARHETRASLVHTRVVHNSPPPPFELILGTAPRLSGQLIAGPEKVPLANLWVCFSYRFNIHTANGIRETLPGEPILLHPEITVHAKTDAHGKFELYTTPGEYSVSSTFESQELQKSVEATLAEVWIPLHFETLHATIPAFSGRIVNSSGQPVPFASVSTLVERKGWEKTCSGTADAEGCFTLPLPPTPFLLLAISRSQHLVGQLRVSATDKPTIVTLGPAVRAVGRLLHPDGTPAGDKQLWCQLLLVNAPWHGKSFITFRACTDSDGGFVLENLPPNQEYALNHFDRKNRRSTDLPNFRTDQPGELSLGDLTLPAI